MSGIVLRQVIITELGNKLRQLRGNRRVNVRRFFVIVGLRHGVPLPAGFEQFPSRADDSTWIHSRDSSAIVRSTHSSSDFRILLSEFDIEFAVRPASAASWRTFAPGW